MANKAVEKRVESLKEKVARLESELAQAKYDLAHAYEDRYPEGRFIICRGNSPVWKGHGGKWFELHYEAGRKRFGFTNNNSGYHHRQEVEPWVWKAGHRCSIFRKTTQYNSLEKMLKAAQKFMVPAALVEVFVKRYHVFKEEQHAEE